MAKKQNANGSERKAMYEAQSVEVVLIGANRCTTCEHYEVVTSVGYAPLYGCKHVDAYRYKAPWERQPSDTPCAAYKLNYEGAKEVLTFVEDAIKSSQAYLDYLRHREAVLTEVIAEYEAAKTVSADGFEEIGRPTKGGHDTWN